MIEKILSIATSILLTLVPTPQPLEDYKAKKKVINLYKKVAPSIVYIKSIDDTLSKSYGAGIIWKEDGTIATAAHVVFMSTILEIADYDSYLEWTKAGGVPNTEPKTIPAMIVQIDGVKDIAVIKIDNPEKTYKAAKLRNLDEKPMEIGEKLAAIGSPYKYHWSYSLGVLSAIRPQVVQTGKIILKAIQTDTALNPGNSGGAVFDMRGRIVGIASISTKTGVAFCIPISEIEPYVQ